MRKRVISILFATILTLPLLSGKVVGILVDENNNPVKNARITIKCGNAEKTLPCSEKGRFLYETSAEKCVLIFRKKTFSFKVLPQKTAVLKVFVSPEEVTFSISYLFSDALYWFLTSEEWERLPLSRDLAFLLDLYPSFYTFDSHFVTSGFSSKDMSLNYEGLELGEETPEIIDFNQIEKLAVKSNVASSGEGNAIQVNFLLPNFTEKLSFQGKAFYSGENLSSSVDEGIAEKTLSLKSGSVQLALPLLKDKLWFWTGASFIKKEKLFSHKRKFTEKNLFAKLNGNFNGFSLELFYQQDREDGKGLFRENGYFDDKSALFEGKDRSRLFAARAKLSLSRSYSLYLKGSLLNVQKERTPSGRLPYAVYDSFLNSYRGTNYTLSEEKKIPYFSTSLVFQGEGVFNAFHDLQLGLVYREKQIFSQKDFYPYLLEVYNSTPVYTYLYRKAVEDYSIRKMSLVLSDNIVFRKTSLFLGLRTERQWISSHPVQAPATDVAWAGEHNLPAISLTERESNFTWYTFSPRFSLSLALVEDGSLVLRFAGGMYTSSLPDYLGSRLASTFGFVRFLWNDLNGDKDVQQEEVTFSQKYDPAGKDPSLLFDSKLSAPRTYEFLTEIALQPSENFLFNLTFYYRSLNNFLWEKPYVIDKENKERLIKMEDWEKGGYAPSWYGKSSWWQLKEGISLAEYGQITNRPYYRENIKGFEVSFTKRGKKLFLSGSFSYLSWKADYRENLAVLDPSNHFPNDFYNNRPAFFLIEGSRVYVNSRWNGKLSVFYKLPWGVDLSALVFARDGFILPAYFIDFSITRRGYNDHPFFLAMPVATFRLPTYWSLNLRAQKEFTTGAGTLRLFIDAFNITDNRIALEKVADVSSPDFGKVLLWAPPRTLRIGLIFAF